MPRDRVETIARRSHSVTDQNNEGRNLMMRFKAVLSRFGLGLMLVGGATSVTVALSAGAAPLSASDERTRSLQVTKECSEYTFQAGSFCTITASNLARIKVGSRIYYDQPAGIPEGMLDSNVVLDAGNNKDRAVGRCTLDVATGLGLCTFSDGMGRFEGFRARVRVSTADGVNWKWEGTYSIDRPE
jgi:hypothetical protein